MTQPSKIAVQYLLNDESSEESHNKSQSHRRARSHRQQNQAEDLNKSHPTASKTGSSHSRVNNMSDTLNEQNESNECGNPELRDKRSRHKAETLSHAMPCRTRKSDATSTASQSIPIFTKRDHHSSISVAPGSSSCAERARQSHKTHSVPMRHSSSMVLSEPSLSRPQVTTSPHAEHHHQVAPSSSSSSTANYPPISTVPMSKRMNRDCQEQNMQAALERQFKCEICGKSFVERGNLNKHVSSVHMKEKPKVCTEPGCNRSFSFRDGLMRHIAHVHRNERSHICTLCEKSFKQPSHLAKHMRTIHKEMQ